MAEIFKEAQSFNNHPGRWNHDWSHKSYGSFKAGRLYPVFTQLLKPTDSVSLDIAALLQFMPTPTPLQSNVRVIFHTFFQRMKNIHEDWPNTIEMLEEHDFPYIKPSVTEFTPGSLHDFLDVPCCVVVNGEKDLPCFYRLGFSGSEPLALYSSSGLYSGSDSDGTTYSTSVSNAYGLGVFLPPTKLVPSRDPDFVWQDNVIFTLDNYPFKTESSSESLLPNRVMLGIQLANDLHSATVDGYSFIPAPANDLPSAVPYRVVVPYSSLKAKLDDLGYDGSQYIYFCLCFHWFNQTGSVTISVNAEEHAEGRVTYYAVHGYRHYFVYGSYSYAEFPDLCPYCTKEYPDRPIKLKAWRYRTYESNYNAFYRNIHGNQPFVVDGVTQYNKYNTTKESGLDETEYHFFNRNWELDAFTSALATPQQGNTPMVGVSSTGRLTIQSDDGSVSTAQLQDLDDGQQGLSISQVNAANDDHRRLIMSLASSGITINDLRETNALQKFLETNIRKGFRYIDFILGHFGKAPKHAEMDMPEFIGGFSVKLDVGKVTNTNQAAVEVDPNAVLGQFAGSAQAFGSNKHTMRYYADDFGYLQVIMCIVPDSAYSQVLPKDFLYNEPLDFPFPEFSQLSYQPITYEEFCPGEAFKDWVDDPSKQLTDVFGYQRPQYECVWIPDRLHGQFLTSMNNYAVNRVFEHRPELGDDFFQIKPEEMQRNFTVLKGDNDIAFGQIGFRCTVKQAVPRIVIPSLGR